MKLLIDIRKISNKPSGIGLYIYNFVKGLMEYSDLELIAVTDVLISDEILELRSSNLNIIEYGKEVNNNIEVFRYFKFIEKVMDREKPQCFWEPNFIMPINLKKKFKNVRFVITVFDLIPILNPEFCSIQYRIYFRYFLYKTLKNIDSIIYISDTVKKQCENKYKFLKDKSSLLNYVIVSDKENRELNELNDGNYFLFVGNIEERKGIRILIEAYKLYVKKGGNKNLKMVGNIRDKKIKELIHRESKENKERIEYLGYVDSNKKNILIKNSSALIFPSYVEGFGMPPVEALMDGKPIIVSNIEIFKEILEDGANYFDIHGDFENCVLNLYNKMCDYKVINNDKIKQLTDKYNYERLTKRLIEFLSTKNK